MTGFTLKVKTKLGQNLLQSLEPTTTIATLKQELSRITNIPMGNLQVLSGFPPEYLDLSMEDKTLESSDIRSGSTLIIEDKFTSVEGKKRLGLAVNEDRHSFDTPGILLKKVVPPDNSCLFTSIGFTLSGKVDLTCGSYMRQVIAEAVASDPDNYNEAILGRPNDEYCKWIQRPSSWGGAIELAILSTFYGVEIAVVDTINAIINRFGEDQSYENRVFLVFDGVHYDPLYLETFEGNDVIKTVFSTSDEKILHEAENLAMEANTSRQFTDVNRFTLQCLDCNIYLTGQDEAVAHAKENGHKNFGEVNPR